MSWAASLPGAERFPDNRPFYKKPLVPGSFAAWGRTLGRKLTFLRKPLVLGSFAAWGRTSFQKIDLTFSRNRPLSDKATCPGQLRCLGQNFFSRNRFFLKMPLVPGSFAAWGRTFSRKSTFLNKPLVPGSEAAWGRTFSRKLTFFEEATCPGQLRCLG